MTLHISEEALLLRRQVQLRQGGRLRVRQGQGLHLLRRTEARMPESIPLGSSRIDPRRAVLTRPDGSETPLTARELRLLLIFAARPGEVISRDELLNMCWGIEYLGTTRTLDQHIFVLRKKLAQDGSRLVSVRSLGYRFQL